MFGFGCLLCSFFFSPLTLGGRERFANTCNVAEVNRKFFNEATGVSCLQSLSASPLTLDRMEAKYLSLAACAAVIKYVEYIQQSSFANGSLRITYRALEGFLHMDYETIRNLELVRNVRSGDAKQSLFGVLNYTKTASGTRLLRTSLLQPLCDRATIEMRLAAVDELLRHERIYFEVSGNIAEFLDLDHLAALQFVQHSVSSGLHGCEEAISNVIYLKQSLDVVPILLRALQSANEGHGPQSALLRTIAANFSRPQLQEMRDYIDRVIEASAHKRPSAVAMRTERYFAVKAGQNGLLDVARKTYTEVLDDVSVLLERYQEQYMMDSLRLKNNAKRGFFFALPCSAAGQSNPNDFGDVFLHVQKSGASSWTFTSSALESLNERLRESGAEISLLTAKVVDEVILHVRTFLGVIHSITDSVSMLDMLQSFATYVTLTEQVVRPELSDSGPIAIKQGMHPTMPHLQPNIQLVPNDTYLSLGNNFALITGQNMAGKSTYCKQVALLTIMAHMGCYVPAAWASFRLTDRIATRIGTEDDLESNSSTFLVEMREMAANLRNATRRSLVIIDELGRGTSVRDGIGLAWAISEYLLAMPCFTLFTTHFRELVSLSALYPNVKLYTIAVDPNFRSTFVLTDGAPSSLHSGYGLRSAAAAGLPASVLDRAHALKEKLQSNAQNAARSAPESTFRIYETVERLLALKNSSLDHETLREFLRDIKSGSTISGQ